MNIKQSALAFILLLVTAPALSQEVNSQDKKCFVGSSLFMLANLTNDPPHFYQLNLGYRITAKDMVSIEFITWTYKGPLGRQYGEDFDNPESDFPGMVQALGRD